jgi:hypothetical protein
MDLGGFSYVFAVKDVSNGRSYALKRMVATDEETYRKIQAEIDIMVIVFTTPT